MTTVLETCLQGVSPDIRAILEQCLDGGELSVDDGIALNEARGTELHALCLVADELRRQQVGDSVTYVVNRNINFTNVCQVGCTFCGFSRGKGAEDAYDHSLEVLVEKARSAQARGATEVCLQGGIHPEYTGDTYVNILRTVKEAVPEMHIHAFSPLEVWQGAATLDMQLEPYLQITFTLADAGPDSGVPSDRARWIELTAVPTGWRHFDDLGVGWRALTTETS